MIVICADDVLNVINNKGKFGVLRWRKAHQIAEGTLTIDNTKTNVTIVKIKYKTEEKVDNIEDMAFFWNILSNKRADTDMELDDIEAGSRSARYAHSLYPNLDPISTFPWSFRGNHAPPPLLPPTQISSTSLNTRKRSQNDDKINSKVRVVEQGSNMPIRVRLMQLKLEFYRNSSIERDWKAISSRLWKIGNGTPRDGRWTTK